MSTRFHGLHITGLIGNLCYPIDEPDLRLYLRLSTPPPLGWAYLFSQVWQTVEYPSKPRVGIEIDALWVECTPDEVRAKHLPHLEWAIEQACERYRAQRQQKETALEIQRELSHQTHLKLDELARSFAPVHEPLEETRWETEKAQSRVGRIFDFIHRLLAAPAKRTPGGRDPNRLRRHKTHNLAPQAGENA